MNTLKIVSTIVNIQPSIDFSGNKVSFDLFYIIHVTGDLNLFKKTSRKLSRVSFMTKVWYLKFKNRSVKNLN